ncbi:cytochrome b/b6 domain-containing protein [Novosphingobium sp. MBES04]|uniref:cytochrome b/b6 domain-containing protein n=1 Tax=Novosphingobium sp. MBES04 TaxID=1206458 RepID=UPI00057FF924|nr:cytochrome b/b6 domain-containing protein [Novosphingobium sp. MBES04]GAM06005.1 Ni/Fe-hydrogenase 1 b-type cytochrome subunit [Novosphingobium sp. MBES04]
MTEGPAQTRIRLWDLPVRLCHWSFVGLIPALWWTAENDEMTWHMRLGLALAALLTFRVLWGFVGSSTARFTNFVHGPVAVARYLASLGKPGHDVTVGHNAAGGWSVLALLGAMALQVALGLISGDPDYGAAGPLYDLAGFELAYEATDWHTEVGFNLILAVIGLHLAAIIFYRIVKRDNLVAPMVTGSRPALAGTKGMAPVAAWRALICAGIGIGFAIWLGMGAPPLTS